MCLCLGHASRQAGVLPYSCWASMVMEHQALALYITFDGQSGSASGVGNIPWRVNVLPMGSRLCFCGV